MEILQSWTELDMRDQTTFKAPILIIGVWIQVRATQAQKEEEEVKSRC